MMNNNHDKIAECIYSIMKKNSENNAKFSCDLFNSYCKKESHNIDFEEIFKFDGKQFICAAYLHCLERLPEDDILCKTKQKEASYILGIINSEEYRNQFSKKMIMSENQSSKIQLSHKYTTFCTFTNYGTIKKIYFILRNTCAKSNFLRKLYALATKKPYIPFAR